MLLLLQWTVYLWSRWPTSVVTSCPAWTPRIWPMRRAIITFRVKVSLSLSVRCGRNERNLGLADLPGNYKLPPSTNTDIPSPSSSSNSSNPPSSTHHPHHSNRRHGEGNDPTRKRAMRLQKNRWDDGDEDAKFSLLFLSLQRSSTWMSSEEERIYQMFRRTRGRTRKPKQSADRRITSVERTLLSTGRHD